MLTQEEIQQLSKEELEVLIKESEEKIARLKPIVEENKRKEAEKHQKLSELMIEHTNTRSTYYNYRTILGDPLIEISDKEYTYLENLMPILETKIELQKSNLSKFVSDNFTSK